MSLLNPLALLLGLLALPILLLYMLKLRRREVPISSTLLWQMTLQDRQANSPWQRLQRNLLLLLQLLILLALVLALARPVLPTTALASGTVVALLDASASMQARDAAGGAGSSNLSRFEAAVMAIDQWITDLPAGSRLTIVQAGYEPHILAAAESDPAALRQALEEARPEAGPANWAAAFALAAGASAGSDPARTTFVLLSDGGLPDDLPPLPGEVRYFPFGSGSNNLAVMALATRPSGSGVELFVQAANFDRQERQVILSLYVDGDLSSAQTIRIPAGGRTGLVLEDLPVDAARYEARLSPTAGSEPTLDDLRLDDAGYAVYQPQAQFEALLVSPGNLFLEQVLLHLPEVQTFRSLAGPTGVPALPEETFDLYVLDGVYPEGLPPGADLLLINPPPGGPFEVTGVFSDTAPAEVQADPLTEFVDWSDVHVRQARQVQVPGWAQVLVDSPGGPLVLAGETGGRRIAALTFDLHDSDLPLSVSFPILFANLAGFLTGAGVQTVAQTGQEDDRPVQAGEPVMIRPDVNADVLVTAPSGQATRLENRNGSVVFARTDELGFYRVSYPGSDPGSGRTFAINLFSELESDITPRESVQVGRQAIRPTTAEAAGQRELWPLFALLALGLTAVEWWVYHRRQRLPVGWFRRTPGRAA